MLKIGYSGKEDLEFGPHKTLNNLIFYFFNYFPVDIFFNNIYDNNYMIEEILLTLEGKQKLENELSSRKDKRKEIIEKIELAREHGDLSENAEYHEARDEQSFNEGRIMEVENILKNATIVSDKKGAKGVQIGSKVAAGVNGQEKEFTIVGSNEGNPSVGFISCDSPLGEALINKEVGSQVEVNTPKGIMIYQIISIK